MARARNIKPAFFKNEQLVELPFDRRLLFIGLWTLADRAGRMEDRPKRIKMEVFPGDDVNVEKALNELHEAGFINRYTVAGDRFIEICNFSKHQHPHFKEPVSTIPKPEALPPSKAPQSLGFDGDGTGGEPETGPGPDSGGNESSLSAARLIPDSPLLIPDSLLNPTTLSGKPDPSPPKSRHKAEAVAVLAFLNERTGRSYQPVKANIDFIAARLEDGATPDELRDVIERKSAQWLGDPKMEEYLRPATLFNRTKFAQYQGETATARPQRRAVV